MLTFIALVEATQQVTILQEDSVTFKIPTSVYYTSRGITLKV